MRRIRMFLDQKKIHHLILYTMVADIVLGYLLKTVAAVSSPLPLAILYLVNILVILAVYRFWKLPVFECDDSGFAFYGISPFNRERCGWDRLEYVCFKEMDVGKGRLREFLILHYVLPNGLHKTNMVPMYIVGFRDKVKAEFLGFLRKKGIKTECLPGL